MLSPYGRGVRWRLGVMNVAVTLALAATAGCSGGSTPSRRGSPTSAAPHGTPSTRRDPPPAQPKRPPQPGASLHWRERPLLVLAHPVQDAAAAATRIGVVVAGGLDREGVSTNRAFTIARDGLHVLA